MRIPTHFVAALALCAAGACQAAVKLPALIGDHMMLQREAPVRIFGWADPGEQVTVRIANQSAAAGAGMDGRWEAWLKPMPAGGPFEMTIAGTNSITVRDVLVGDVWVASGQSNMVMTVQNSNDAAREIATANKPRIRLFKVELKTSSLPLEDVKGSWALCSPDSVKGFSAAGYFFARHLEEKLQVPMGVIQSAWGGTPAEGWTSRAMLISDEALQRFMREWDERLVDHPEAARRYAAASKRHASEAAEAKRAGREVPRPPQPPAGPGHQHEPAEGWTSRAMLISDEALQRFMREWDERLVDHPEAVRRYAVASKRHASEVAEAKRAGREVPRPPQPPAGPGHQHEPAVLYNAMIAPLTPYTIRGAIWYQGENNANKLHGPRYRHLFESMIRDWRLAWGIGDFPFFFVQLANFARVNDPESWPLLREAQTDTLEVRNTGMAVIIDVGDAQDIHPKNKQDVGLRLALAARGVAYGEKIVYSGPLYRQVTQEGDNLRVWLDHTGGGLQAKGGELKGFVIAGENKRFVPAKARIDGNTIVVSSDKVRNPVAVRYAWANYPDCNLYNAEGLPASPFRSDRWTGAAMPE